MPTHHGVQLHITLDKDIVSITVNNKQRVPITLGMPEGANQITEPTTYEPMPVLPCRILLAGTRAAPRSSSAAAAPRSSLGHHIMEKHHMEKHHRESFFVCGRARDKQQEKETHRTDRREPDHGDAAVT